MDNGIQFSVIVPIYNVEKYLEKCINSILGQSYEDYELILVDDGSTDTSGQICDKYIDVDNRIRVIHQNNKGLSVARNIGVENANGEYIIFLDSDDYWYDNKVLSDLNDRLRISCADVLSFDYVKFTDEIFEKSYFNGKENMPLNKQMNTLKYQIDNDLWIACAWNKVIKKSIFEKSSLLFKEGITSEDIDWCLRLALSAQKFDYLSRVVVCYRQRSTSISKSITPFKVNTLIDNIEYCLELLNCYEEKEKASLLKSYVGYQYGTAIYLVSNIKDKKEHNSLIERLNKNKQLLKWSKNRKIKLLRYVNGIGGNTLVMFMLRLRDKMK